MCLHRASELEQQQVLLQVHKVPEQHNMNIPDGSSLDESLDDYYMNLDVVADLSPFHFVGHRNNGTWKNSEGVRKKKKFTNIQCN